ncbi:MAG: hypothetical protein AB1585_22345 [Thermodesulfobacteriota bacterium]
MNRPPFFIGETMEHALEMIVDKRSLHYFFSLFQKGVGIKISTGGNLRDLLTLTLKIPSDYVENRIQTIFLDGKAVDNPEEAFVREGSTLALSAAMPGLVGATLRRSGAFSSLRRAITLSEEEEPGPKKEGRIILKLFNLLVPELAPSLLIRGVLLKGNELNKFLEGLPDLFWGDCREAFYMGRRVESPFQATDLVVERDTLTLLKVVSGR